MGPCFVVNTGLVPAADTQSKASVVVPEPREFLRMLKLLVSTTTQSSFNRRDVASKQECASVLKKKCLPVSMHS